MEYKCISVETAKKIAIEFDKQQVVIIAVDHPHDKVHTVTFGVSPDDKVEAANLGEYLAKQMGLDLTKSVFNEDFRRDFDAAKYKATCEALEESVKLQSHYAGLLNNYDGGQRIQFKSSEEWLARLAQLHKPSTPTS